MFPAGSASGIMRWPDRFSAAVPDGPVRVGRTRVRRAADRLGRQAGHGDQHTPVGVLFLGVAFAVVGLFLHQLILFAGGLLVLAVAEHGWFTRDGPGRTDRPGWAGHARRAGSTSDADRI